MLIANADSSGGQDSTVKLFDASSGECLHTLGGLEHGTGSIAFSPTTSLARPGGLLAGGGWNGKVILWDVEVRRCTINLLTSQTGDVLKEYEIEEELDRQSSRDKPMMVGHLLCFKAYHRSDGNGVET